jgi:hypothetical protein
MGKPRDPSPTPLQETESYLQTLRESAPKDTFFDVRYRTENGFAQFFTDINDPSTAEKITQLDD